MAAGTAIDDDDVMASIVEHRDRELLAAQSDAGVARVEQAFLARQRRDALVADSVRALGPPPPGTATIMQQLQQMQQQLQQVLQQQQQMLQQQQDISDRMDIAELRREQDLARAQNLRVADRTVQLTPLPHVTHPGVATPPGFPATADALRDLPGQVLHNVMVAYGLVPVPHLIAARITQLAVFIGVDRLVG